MTMSTGTCWAWCEDCGGIADLGRLSAVKRDAVMRDKAKMTQVMATCLRPLDGGGRCQGKFFTVGSVEKGIGIGYRMAAKG